jgi:FlaA1/EpsC-like NDP-sugar epimerase|tara:strand:+ start:189 stop:1376 length:1188 start_codon:yes stop_codon:yes gene_type:complete
MDILKLIGRKNQLFIEDITNVESDLSKKIKESSFLILGGAGSIGQSVVKEIFKRNPNKIHVVDISENNLVELVRDLRSSYGYIDGDFKTFALDIGSNEYDAFIQSDGSFDYVLNLSALKHVRSEKDPYTLMRMIDVNIFNTQKTLNQSIEKNTKKYFCVSTDKAANPANMMGASKRIMEMFVNKQSEKINVSMARFANVAFSDGSLLHGFNKRIEKKQPIVAPNDIKRYFVTPKESGELCLMSCIYGENRDIFFPKLNENLHLITFSSIALKFLDSKGYKPFICSTEDEARNYFLKDHELNTWPCFFTNSDTSGEKDFEEFYTDTEELDLNKFKNLGIIKNKLNYDTQKLSLFESTIQEFKTNLKWDRKSLKNLFTFMIPDFAHKETGKFLDSKM